MNLQQTYGEWADRTFPEETPENTFVHLTREVVELSIALNAGIGDIGEEMADVFLLLLYLAHQCDVDLNEAALVKFGINKLRKWGKPDEQGVVEHVREEPFLPIPPFAISQRCDKTPCHCHRTAEVGIGFTHCPAHDDQIPSLEIARRGEKVIFHCHAGCSQEAILAAMQLKSDPPQDPNRRVVTGRWEANIER